MKATLACGLISGTSRDGVDAAIIEIRDRFPRNRIRLVCAKTFPYPGWLKKVLAKPGERFSSEEIAALDFLLGEIFAQAALRLIKIARLKPEMIDVIGSHGQTILHKPRGIRLGRRRIRATLQVGSGTVIAALTGITTIFDFRTGDVALGGEGAPLVPIYDYVVLTSKTKTRLALNIGGISNVSVLPKGGKLSDVQAFDCGPGNCMIDIAVSYLTNGRKSYDRDGKIALEGRADGKEVARILSHPYFRRRPPKSTGWSEFGYDFTIKAVRRMKRRMKTPDIIRTLTEATCKAILHSIRRFVLKSMPVDEVIVTGGGVHNPVIMACLSEGLSDCKILKGEDVGISSDWKEACAFAYLAYLHHRGRS